jgi:hypothetical protein
MTSVVYFGTFSLPPAYAAELLLGVPAWLAFRKYRVRSIYSYALCGAGIGLVAMHIISVSLYPSWIDGAEYLLSPSHWMNLPTWSADIGGLLSAVLFRYIALRKAYAVRA